MLTLLALLCLALVLGMLIARLPEHTIRIVLRHPRLGRRQPVPVPVRPTQLPNPSPDSINPFVGMRDGPPLGDVTRHDRGDRLARSFTSARASV